LFSLTFVVRDVRRDTRFASADRREIALYNAGRIVYGVNAGGGTRVQPAPGAITMTSATPGAGGVHSARRHDLATRWLSTAC
jgi:hypothetical protein